MDQSVFDARMIEGVASENDRVRIVSDRRNDERPQSTFRDDAITLVA
jgi:hypothetical protein